MYILLLVVGLVIGIAGCFLILRPRLIAIQSIDQEIEIKNQELQTFNETLSNKNAELLNDNSILMHEKLKLEARRDELAKGVNTLEEQASVSAAVVLQQALNTAQETLSYETEKLAFQFQQNKDDYQKEYLSIMNDCVNNLNQALAEKTNRIAEAAAALKKLEETAAAAVAASIRDQEKKDKLSFYTLNITKQDKDEIDKLREVATYLRNQEPLNKVIWKTYYEKPCTDLLGRIINSDSSVGIYKISNLSNNMIYIGQSVDLKTRLKTHIKAGLGIDASNNKLYTAMQNETVDNFSFEIIEYCERSELNEKEKYWIKYYHSDTFGYNMTQGNTKTKGE